MDLHPRRHLWHLSLRTKLALALGAASLLPLLVVSAVGLRVALGRLERGLMSQARQTAHITLNLLLREVQKSSRSTNQLALDPEIHELMAVSPQLVANYLETYFTTTNDGLVEVVDTARSIIARFVPSNPRRYQNLHCPPESRALSRALNYERFITLDVVKGQLVIQAAAPIVDSMFVLRGAVVISTPLDDQMADYLKGVVRADVSFFSGTTPLASTFIAEKAVRSREVRPPPSVSRRVLRGRTENTQQTVSGRQYAMAYAPLQTVEGKRVGMLSVGLSWEGLTHAQASAAESVLLGAAASLALALIMGLIVGRRITTPLAHLHRSTQAIAAGDLDYRLAAETEDEIGDLARAFQQMTEALREHQERLAARVREITTVHQIGRAVSSVLSLDQVLRLVVTEATGVLGAEKGALLLYDRQDNFVLRAQVGLPHVGAVADLPAGWLELARDAVLRHSASHVAPTLAVPLETREHVVGALLIARRENAAPLAENELRLVVTFADQAATALDNARLYDEVKTFSQELEATVAHRTAELRATNEELAYALNELKETQAMLIHSERMAGLGVLIAGVAHEINSPAGAIQGAAQALSGTLDRLISSLGGLLSCDCPAPEMLQLFNQLEQYRRLRTESGLLPPAEMRRRTREVAVELEQHGVADSQRLAKQLLAAGAASMTQAIGQLATRVSPKLLVSVIEDLAFLERSSSSIQTAINALVRLVRALKSYAHMDQEAIAEVDVTEGLETTLTILHSKLRYGINVIREYAPLPKIPAYVDELNQVWTNLIHNSIQAMQGKGEIVIETGHEDDHIGVSITDNGPGIPADIYPRIFEPFFTTKSAGEGSGLGLDIARKIVHKHGGTIEVASRPGCTTFRVLLPVAGPPSREKAADAP